MRHDSLLGLLFLASGSSCFADTGDVDVFGLSFEELSRLPVSIATGSQQPLAQAPSTATVITADAIAAMGATDLDQVLETVPGLHVLRVGGVNQPHYEIRGIGGGGPSNPRVLLLQNGIPVNTLFTGDPGQVWGGYPVENIARIEVIRGPGSALYGADAVAGVINIITKTSADAGTEFGLRGGNEHSRDAWLRHGGNHGWLGVEGYVRASSTEGGRQIIRQDNQSGLDQIFGSNASLAPGPENNGVHAVDASLDLSHEHWRWRSGYKLRDEVGTGAGVGSALDPVGRGHSERLTTDLSWTNAALSEHWGAGSTLSYLQYVTTEDAALQILPPGATLPTGSFPEGMIGAPQYWDRQLRLSAYASYSGFSGHQWRLGAGHDVLNLYKTREFKNFTFAPNGLPVPAGSVMDFTGIAPFMLPQLREVNYAYVQDVWTLTTDLTLTGGLRHDNYSDAGGTTNPRLALVWQASDTLTAKLMYGTAFRAPSFNEAYSINNPVERGNPALRPETIRTGEADLGWQARPGVQVNLSLFHYSMADIIHGVANATPGTGSTEQNDGGQTGHGGELEIAWDARRNLRLSGNYAYQHALDNNTGGDAGYAPHRQFYAMADWRFSRSWQAGLAVNRVAGRARTAGDSRPPVPDYTTVDVSLRSRRGAGHWDMAAGVRNLFSADVREPSPPGTPTPIPADIPTDPRTFYLQLSYSL